MDPLVKRHPANPIIKATDIPGGANCVFNSGATMHNGQIVMLLSAWVIAFLPRDWVTVGFGEGRWWGVPAAVLLGVPGYFCGGGAVPLVHGLLAQGMSHGAALAFLLGGPATTPRNLAALGTVTGWRGLASFLVVTQGGAIALGLMLDLIG